MDSLSISTPTAEVAPNNIDAIANIPVPQPKSITFLSTISSKEYAFHNKSDAITAGVEYCSRSTFGFG